MHQAARPRDASPESDGRAGEEAAFRQLVRDALGHLYDLPYLQSHQLARFIEPKPRRAEAGAALRQCLLKAIESLRPQGPLGSESHAWRYHGLLTLRYVEGIDAEGVAERLSISRSELFRDQRKSVEAVASLLRVEWGVGENSSEPPFGQGSSVTDGTSADLPRPFSLVAEFHPSNLPKPWTSFVGRRVAIEEVTGLLRTSRLVTLTGAGGCGKTRLALEVARGLLEEYDSAIWLVDLGPLAQPALVPNLVATALAVRDQAGEPLSMTIRRQLRDRRLLLVLDNCEHLVDACGKLADELLQSCSGLSILATSREALRLPGEVVWPVPPLGLPSVEERSPETLMRSEAVRLLVERAKAVRPTFAMTPENAIAIGDLCRRLDGIPLALELAAARVRVLSVEQVAERLDDRFNLLAVGSRAAAPRQQTLRATLDWSYQLLDEEERLFFTRLSVFSGAFGLAAVESVCSDERLKAGQALEVLSQLVDRSMVLASPLADGRGEVWYRLLETMREYGWELAELSGEASRLRQRHADYYLALVAPSRENAALTPPLENSPGGTDRFAMLDGEYANVRAALLWLEANDQAHSALLMASELWAYWSWVAPASEGLGHLTRLVLLCGDSEPTLEHARALMNTGLLHLHKRADLEVARGYLEESLASFRQLGGSYGIGHSLLSLGKVARLVGDYDLARAYAEEARPILEGIADRFGLGWLAYDLSDVACDLCEYEYARHLGEEAGRLWQGMGPTLAACRTLLLVRTAYLRGDYPEARLLLENLDIHVRLRSGRTAEALAWLGLIDVAEGSYTSARSRLGQGLRSFNQRGLRAEAQLALDGLASLACAEGDAKQAVCLAGAAEALRGEIGLALAPCWQLWRASWLEPARKMLGSDVEAAWAEGRAMTLEQAVEYALQDDDEA